MKSNEWRIYKSKMENAYNLNGLSLKTRYDCINDAVKTNQGPVVLYGLTFWTSMLISQNKIKVNYVCDKRAIEGGNAFPLKLFGVPVVDINRLHGIINERATIIICVGINKAVVDDIYYDLIKLDLNADVYNYFDNAEVFRDKDFQYKGEIINLFEHPINCGYRNTRMTERSIELALAKRYIDLCDELYEIGAVTPYYMNEKKIKKIIDPTDPHVRVSKASLFDVNLDGENVLSISTVEHIGTSDYGMHESYNVIDAVDKIISESKSCLITAPFGYNKLLDKWVGENRDNSMVHFFERKINNHWEEIDLLKYDLECIYTPLWANGLIVIEK